MEVFKNRQENLYFNEVFEAWWRIADYSLKDKCFFPFPVNYIAKRIYFAPWIHVYFPLSSFHG